MKVIYIAGPYRNKNPFTVRRNILSSAETAAEVWRMGAAAICPHLNTALFEYYVPEQPDDLWLRGDIEILKRCDALLALNGYHKSRGTMAEVEEAQAKNIPVFHDLKALGRWLKRSEAE